MPTVAEIAAQAFAAVSVAIPGVIMACTVTRTVPGTYDPETGTTGSPTETQATGECVIDQRDQLIGSYARSMEIQETDTLMWVRGLSFVPRDLDTITVGGVTRTIVFVDDLAQQGAFMAVIAR